MQAEVFSEVDWDALYSEGYDDGYAGHTRKNEHPAYLEGYYDGEQEADEEDEYDSFEAYDYSDWDDED